MSSRQIPNEHERQPSCSRFGFRSRLQTIMEVDSSASRTPSVREKKQERGVKRPLVEMIGQPVYNSNNYDGQRVMSPQGECVAVRVCGEKNLGVSSAQHKQQQQVASRPAKRPVPSSKGQATTGPAHDSQKRCCRAACQKDQQKRTMKPSQMVPSGGGVPKLIRNQVKPVTDEQRAMHKRLQIEHLQLQRSFALWRQLVEEARSHQDNEELASWAQEKEGIIKSTRKLQDKVEELQEKLTEYRDQNELLEFRILELDHCQTKQCPPCADTMTSPQQQPGFCSTGCTQPDDPCFRHFHDQITLYQDLEFRADELLEELRLLSALPGLSCGQRTALARSAACVARCKGEVRSAIGLLTPQPLPADGQEQTTQDQAQFLGSEWLDKILFGRGRRGSGVHKAMEEDEAELSDQSLLQETSMTESEIGQALISDWPGTLVESHHKTVEQQHSEDEGLGEDSRRSTEPNSLVSEDPDAKSLQTLVEDLRRKNSTLRTELQQAEILVRTLKTQADRVQELETQLTRTERERSEYQEQILELEEAENDARLESQTLRALVDNLRQHEDDLEKSLCATRDRLEECEQRASSVGATAEELRSQVGYLEELVYKYEEHIEGLEKAESELHKKLLQQNKDYVDVQVQVDDIRKDCCDVSVQVEVEGPVCRCPQKKDLLARLQSLEEKDGVLREQLHQVDGINLKLWQKLHCLETDIGECKRQELSWGPEQHHREAAARLEGLLGVNNTSKNINTSQVEVGDSEVEIGERLLILECNERKLREQLLQLERINQDFERELEIRERLNRDREREHTQWVERERELKVAIEQLEMERVSLREQTSRLEEERSSLRDALEQLQEEYGRLKLAHCQETQDLHARHQEASQGMEDTRGQDEEDFQQVMRLSREALQLRSEQEELRTQVAEMSLAFETELRALRACHELEEKRLHDEMVSLRCRDDQCCTQVQELAAQRERLESVLAEREQQLEALTIEFQRKSDAMDEEKRLVENELQRKMREMEESTASAVKELEEKRKQLEMSLRVDMEDLRCKENSYKVRIRDLERHVDSLRQEITSLAQGVGSEEYGSEEDGEYRRRIEDLEKKEAAYVETLQNADKIISQMELRYRDNIQRLEGSERSLQERVVQLETTEAELRSALHNERRTSDSGRMTDLVRELMDAEVRENSLKEHADELEASHKALLQKVRDLERTNQQISEELRDHEEASVVVGELRREQEKLRDEISQLKRSEAALKETLTHADAILAQREHVLAAKVSELEHEKQGSDEMVRQLREHVRSLQEQLDQAQFHQPAPSPRENADTEVSREEISDLKLEVRRLQQCLSATQAHLGDLDSVRRNQERIIDQLQDGKVIAEKRIRQLQRVVKVKEGELHTGEQLQNRVLELEKLIRRSSWSSGETKETQTEKVFYCSSRCATAPVSPASSLNDLSNYHTPKETEGEEEEEEEEMMMRRDELEDANCLGIEERMELEHCMKRAMAAMERDLQRKTEPQQKKVIPPFPSRIQKVFPHEDEEEDEEEEEEEDRIRMPPSPACSSTSGCESDCSSSGGSCHWPTTARGRHDNYVSDEEQTPKQSQIERHTVTSRELPTLMQYPSVDGATLERDHHIPDAPSDFCILRRVGRDSLLLGWTPPTSVIDSYQILVNGEVQQRVRSPDRTKALLHKLDLTRTLSIAIRSLVAGSNPQMDLLSEPALLTYEPTQCHKS